jgi:hypothetical protein
MAKKQSIDMGNYVPKTAEYEAMYWCVDNNIKISPKALSTLKWSIVLDINGKITESPDAFPKIIIWQKIWEYYKYYYNKYGNKI